MLQRLGFDQAAGGRAANFFVGDHHDRDRQQRLASGGLQVCQCCERDGVAALHVIDAGPVGAISLDAERQRSGECAGGVDGVDVAEQQ
jgi:hypothetical protein